MRRARKIDAWSSAGFHGFSLESLLCIGRTYRVHHLKRPGILRLTGREHARITIGDEMRGIKAMHQFAMAVFELPHPLPQLGKPLLVPLLLKIAGLVLRYREILLSFPAGVLSIRPVKRLLRQPLALGMLLRRMPAPAVLAGIRFREDLSPGDMMGTRGGLAKLSLSLAKTVYPVGLRSYAL
jgi:hypothetical protein